MGIDQSEVSRLVNGRKRVRDRVQAKGWLQALGAPGELIPLIPEADTTADVVSDLTQLLNAPTSEGPISRLEQAAERMGKYPELGPLDLWNATQEDLRFARNLLTNRLSLRTHEKVLRAVAILAGTSAHLLMDMADHIEADRHMELSIKAGHELDDQDVYAWCLGMAAVQNGVHLDWVTAAARLGKARQLRLEPGRRTAWLAAQEARAHAGLGDESEAMHMLERARYELEQANEPTAMDFFDQARLDGVTGTVHLMLNRLGDASNTINEAIKKRRSDDVKGIAFLMLDDAECHVRKGDPEAAGQQVLAAARRARRQLVAPIRTRMRQLRRQMSPWADTVAVRQLDAELRGIMTKAERYEHAMDGSRQS
jgi:hypothetical protein